MHSGGNIMIKEFKMMSENDLNKINGGVGVSPRLVEYTIQTGDSPDSVAQRFKTSIAMLYQLNPGLSGNFRAGLKITVPAV